MDKKRKQKRGESRVQKRKFLGLEKHEHVHSLHKGIKILGSSGKVAMRMQGKKMSSEDLILNTRGRYVKGKGGKG